MGAAEATEEALHVLWRWLAALGESDVAAITSLHGADALFLGTGSKMLVTAREGIRAYFEAAFREYGPMGATTEHSVMALSESVVVVTGLDTLTGVRDGEPFSAPGRFTLVLAKRRAEWQIVHFHRSVMPS